MNKGIMTLFIGLVLILTGAMPEKEKVDPIQTMTAIATSENIPMVKWEIIYKDTLLQSQFNNFMNNIRNSTLIAESRLKYKLVYENDQSIDVEFHTVALDEAAGQLEVTAIISGSEWNSHVQAEYDHLNDYLSANLFTGNEKRFTCIELLEDDTIEAGVIIELYKESLQMIQLEEQQDTFELSKLNRIIYGYSPLWDEKLVIDGVPYNVQIAAVQTETGKTSYVIGTPILMNEY